MRRLVPLGIVLLMALGSLAPGAAQVAEPERIVAARDAAGDVRLTRHPEGLNERQRRSIDIRVLKIVDLADRVRITVRLKRITRSREFLQRIQLTMPAKESRPTTDALIGLVPQRPGRAFAWPGEADASEETEDCQDIRSRARRKAREVSVVVPKKCLPSDPRPIRVATSTGGSTDETPTHSRDRLRVPGRHALR